ncbi:hypothetical protein Pint_20020 [Pistacia integerrima]|uniref:Uncharacterized protein n=1 Tax=Pistacia integerrima TaxID=434235 RepID=A0ACC0XF73_9ROSI|nr:hypothetical protein Pint_20020 [Pistacia integerrima]
MVDIAGNVAGIVSAVLDVDKCFMYLLNHKSNIRILEREVGKLKVARDEVERKVEVARNNVEMIEEIVEQWVIKVNSIVPESETLIKERANVQCFSLKARYKQSRKASKKVKDVAELLHLQEAFGDQPPRPPNRDATLCTPCRSPSVSNSLPISVSLCQFPTVEDLK